MCNTASHLQVILLAAAFVTSFIPPLASYHVLVYRLYMQLVLVAHVLRLAKTVGAPPLWPFSLPALKHWFARTTATSDSHYLLIAFMYMAQQPFLPFMISPLLLASLRFAAVVQKNVPSTKAALSPLLAQRVRALIVRRAPLQLLAWERLPEAVEARAGWWCAS